MRVIDIIDKKRIGGEHTREEIELLVRGYAGGQMPDYQMSAWLMAVLWRGLTREETFALTGAMVDSGETLDLSSLDRPTIDKHSTGGVGDKTSLAVVPILAAAGAAVAKMSGRGLGHTGGTLDKLESIPGFRVALEIPEILTQVRAVGACLCAQTAALVPADKQMYALRDATATVQSRELIAASIMSKKIASGGKSIVLDVKVGRGAFMETLEDARALAELMVDIGTAYGRRVVAVLTDMNVPLGRCIGNRIEIREVVDLLRNNPNTEPRLREAVLSLSGLGLHLAGIASSVRDGVAVAERLIEGGSAFETFCRIVEAQGGDAEFLRSAMSDESDPAVVDVYPPAAGYVHDIDASVLGLAAMRLGAGRETKEASIDHAAGIVLCRTVGEDVHPDTPIAKLYCAAESVGRRVAEDVAGAFRLSAQPVPPAPLIYDTIGMQPESLVDSQPRDKNK